MPLSADEQKHLLSVIEELRAALKMAHQRIEQLSNELNLLKQSARGSGYDPNQALFGFSPPPLLAEPVHQAREARPAPQAPGHGRRAIPATLPRQRKEYHPPEPELNCACCGQRKQRIGEELSHEYDYEPSTITVIEHARIKYACRACQDGVVLAPVPDKLIDKGLAGPGLLAHILACKYCDHLPLYRMEEILQRTGVSISRSTMCGWIGTCADLLAPVYEAVRREVLRSPKIHTDDTTVEMLEPGAGKTRTARLWVYLGQGGQACYEFTLSRNRDGPARFLKDFQGYLQADAYGGYDGLYVNGAIKEVACWAHARRKFDEAVKTDPRAVDALAYIRALYEVEDQARALTPEGRLVVRREHSIPILERCKEWLNARSQDVLPKSPLGQAVRYTQSQWNALTRYTEDGILDPDNNAAERALRSIAIGRKNWLFVGNQNGGERAAVIYTLIAGCKLAGHDSWAYLKTVLSRISYHPAKDILELTPARWKPAQS